ncbi:signal transduction histidine kinase [Streptomyces sp. SAI-133]|uniref:ATP-binding response regulator n=1 Tax=unclassified Streptomyces TaxID=2593676 RepID=UPI00247587F7|nr:MULTISPECIES: ATP-binding protein [unclassified Streptomyces]MDH6553402.1 signal transduction histidine kinase [Streptomyces sp. SAI-041]MDH6582557.1 signal transduction histidine kinase [Streptomyces sp. SAI-133]
MPDTPDFRRLFDSNLSPLLVLTPDFVIVEVNRAYLTATRTDRSIVGRPIFDVFPDNPEDPSADGVANLRRSLETVVASGRTDTMALQRYDIPTSEPGVFAERYWSPVNAPVLDDEGRLTHIIHRGEDVTEFVHLRRVGREQQRAVADAQMRAEGMEIDLFVRAREIREVNEQLNRVNAELDASGRRLREEQRAKDRFIATLSHELRNPLAAATAATELLALDMPEGHPALAVLERQLGTLARMSNDLLDGTRAVTGRLELVREPVDLRSVVEGACADIHGLFAHDGRTLDVRLPDAPLVVDGDRLRLAQVLTNLLSNALKYTRPGGRTEVELADGGGEARLTVRDDGIGFAPGQAEELFGVFMRAAPAGPDTPEGLGLGLAVARTIAELHHGRVGAHSDGPGTGATFTVVLPADGAPALPPPRSTPARSASRGLAVLIVEDNEDLAATYHTLLERQGHRVTTVHTGTAALTATGAQAFDVVLCDLGLPDIDGHTVARRVRARPGGERLRLIALSGFSQGTDRALSRAAGFDAHLTKPLPLTELTDVLERRDGG